MNAEDLHMEVAKKYEDWSGRVLEDPDLTVELAEIAGKESEIYERFYTDLVFGTAGLRGILGVGTNRMNIYTVRRATQGLAAHIRKENLAGGVAIADRQPHQVGVFLPNAAEVIAATNISVCLTGFDAEPCAVGGAVTTVVPGVRRTASHNPSINGYNGTGGRLPMTSEAADSVYAAMLQTTLWKVLRACRLMWPLRSNLVRPSKKRPLTIIRKGLDCRAAGCRFPI
jgi:phosphoglucomutase